MRDPLHLDPLYQFRRMVGPFSFADPEEMVRAEVELARSEQSRRFLAALERRRRLANMQSQLQPSARTAASPDAPLPIPTPAHQPGSNRLSPALLPGRADADGHTVWFDPAFRRHEITDFLDRTPGIRPELIERYAKYMTGPVSARDAGSQGLLGPGAFAPTDRDSLGQPFPSRPGTAVKPEPRDPQTRRGIQVAGGPALFLPFFAGATGADMAALAAALGMTSAAALLGYTTSNPVSKSTPRLGSSFPNVPPELPEDDGKETYPAQESSPTILVNPAIDPDLLPDLDGFRPDDLPDLIEIFPDQSAELPKAIVLESRGNDRTQAGLNRLRGFGEGIADLVNPNAKHVGGAHTNEGVYAKETYLPNVETSGRKGSSKVDLTFEDKVTNRRLYINTVDTKAKGTQETKREHGSGIRIIVNAKKGDVLFLIHKTEDGEVWNEEELERPFSELLREIGRPKPTVDPRTVKPLEELIHRFMRKPPLP